MTVHCQKHQKFFFSNKPPKMKYRQNFLSFFSVWFNKSDIIMADVGPLFISFICRAATSRHSEWFIDSSRLQGCWKRCHKQAVWATILTPTKTNKIQEQWSQASTSKQVSYISKCIALLLHTISNSIAKGKMWKTDSCRCVWCTHSSSWTEAQQIAGGTKTNKK